MPVPALLFAALLSLMPAPATSAPQHAAPGLVPGVSQELARWRAQRYRDVRYALRFELRAGAESLRGRLDLRVTLGKAVPDLVLDWRSTSPRSRLENLRVNGAPLAPVLVNEHLVVPAAALRAGVNRVELEFETPVAASGSAVTRYRDREDGAEYLYTLLVPADARSVFPCFDQPDLKARYTLELALPEGWTAVSNAPAAERSAGGLRFRESEPISTYLFAFAAGPFASITDGNDPTRLLVRRSREARARAEAPELLRLNRAALDYYAKFFAHPYPFAKYDLVLIPEFPYGGMEHAGATFLNETSVLFPAPPDQAEQLRRAQLLFHEAAHQWFGNLVTMRWFDDLWLKEGFANYMAARAVAELTGLPAWTAFHALKTSAYRTDVTPGSTPIRRDIANLADAKSAYGAIVYSKAPALLRQAEFMLGRAAFERGVRDFVRRHAWGAADWHDLIAALERASGRRLEAWAQAWVQRRGLPEVRARWMLGPDRRVREFTLAQEPGFEEPGNSALPPPRWPLRVELALHYADGSTRTHRHTLRGGSARLRALEGLPEPLWVQPNAGDHGYGRFMLDRRSRDALLDDPGLARPGLDRAQAIEALWESVRDAELDPLEFLQYAVEVIRRREDDEIVLAGLLSRIETAFRRYLSDAQRDRAARTVERALLDGMLDESSAASRRIAFLRAYAGIAWTREGQAELKRLLDGALEVPGVPLASRERFRLIARLLARNDPEAHSRLAAQAALDRSDDGARWAFAAGAAAADAATKHALLELFLTDATLAESWIEEALPVMNAPEHADLTRRLLDRALGALPELKRKRKIFFVNRWLEAFVGGQRDASSRDQVRAWAQREDLDPDLRLKLLEALDGLTRSAFIRARHRAP